MVLSKREKFSLYLMVVAILTYLIYTYGLNPTLRRLEFLQEELLNKKVRLAKGEALLKEKARIEEDYRRIEPLLDEEEGVPNLLHRLSKMAKASGVKITRIRQGPYKGEESSKGISLELNLEGDMNALARFLHDLKNSPYLSRVDSLRIRPKQEDYINLDIHLILSVKGLGFKRLHDS